MTASTIRQTQQEDADSVAASEDKALLRIAGLKVAYDDKEVLHGVDMNVRKGDIYAVVGASGSGKSTLLSTVLGLYAPDEHITAGSISLDGTDLRSLSSSQWRSLRRNGIGYVPQDPVTNLNPSMRVGAQIADAIKASGVRDRAQVRKRVIDLMNEVGIPEPERRMRQYPHEFSGGMCQRILIAIALSCDPSLIIADEPTSALDVTVQKTILDFMVKLVKTRNATLLFITHNLALAAERANTIAVMHEGEIVEIGTPRDIVLHPQDRYTETLIAAAPGLREAVLPGVDASSETGAPDSQESQMQTSVEPAALALEVKDVVKDYHVRGNAQGLLRASDHVSFAVRKGTTTALVGESGSGKTTLARLMLGLESPTSGEILINGQSINASDRRGMHEARLFVQPVFQNPYASLDPTYRILDVIREPLDIAKRGTREERDDKSRRLLDAVALPQSVAYSYPSQLSGGQRQRVAVARALAMDPQLLILDEAVSALDVLVQDQILKLLHELQQRHGYTYVFITHDLGVARQFADEVVVLRSGKIEDAGPVEEVFEHPGSDYTRNLLDAIPHPDLGQTTAS
ncbi:MAG: ABC transporter ATP-binding protein [Bifidobacterium subtile]|jgi:peptide/nickel transport system ATP-binding protein|nr:ABC transporter ATP-binding protein [Bifidobacterium subtile]MCI1258595.1 ABC transporter ATP-binding protein [Bifidobacterium subtile]